MSNGEAGRAEGGGPPGRRILYIFPHPDDECFGPGPVIRKQKRAGHRVDLLTLTRGEATRQREKLGVGLEEMGRIREEELRAAGRVLGIDELTVLDFPDGGLKDLDPLELEEAVERAVDDLRPHVLVTYAVHGISGHPDHLVTHAVVKRVFCALRGGRREGGGESGELPEPPRRLAMFTLVPDQVAEHLDLGTSEPEEVGCAVRVSEGDVERGRAALDRYETYREVIEKHRPLDHIGHTVRFELFRESHDPPLTELTDALP